MTDLATLQLVSAGVLLGAIALSFFKGERSRLLWTWMAFCASATASLLFRALGDQLGLFGLMLLAPISATCGVAWLLARSLFRPDPAFGRAHLAAVAIIAAVNLAPAGPLGAALGSLQSLLASAVIVLTIWEAVRGWSLQLSRLEQMMRAAFLASVGGAVLFAVVWLRSVEPTSGLTDFVQTMALLGVTVVAGACVLFRQRFALETAARETSRPGGATSRPVDREMRRLGARLDTLVRTEALFLESDLKVADLARKLQTPEYKVTRAITGALQAPNFNQYINRFRIDFACQLMEDDPCRPILAVAFDSGFASIGPFNRAFKALKGQTPRAYRASLDDRGSVVA